MSERAVPVAGRNPWAFVPLMYFLQALPVSLVQDVATIVYKDFGIDNESIIRWTVIAGLPYSLQMFFGPLVELSSTRRQWFLRTQFVISAALIALPFLLRLPAAFQLSLVAFLVTSIFSTICNAAQDGYYLLALAKDEQARFAGILSTFSRLGALFAKGLLVLLAGRLMAFSSAEIRSHSSVAPPWSVGSRQTRTTPVIVTIKSGALVDQDGTDAAPGLRLSADVKQIDIASDGRISADGQAVGQLRAADIVPVQLRAQMSPRDAWTVVLLLGGLVYLGFYLLERRFIPRPLEDVEHEAAPQEVQANVRRTLTVVGLGIASYFTANAAVRLGAHLLWALRDGTLDGPLRGWHLPDNGRLVGISIPGPGTTAELVQLGLCGVAAVLLLAAANRTIKGTAMSVAFGSFFRQSGIVAVLAFLMFYRFGEAMIMRMSPLFLKDPSSAGGLGLGTDDVGKIKGIVGLAGIVLGGILGGLVVSRAGLRKSIWPLATFMHLPGLLYLWASHARPSLGVMYGVDFAEQFGYGFGFAGYTIILQRIAQKGNFRTAHYALGVGVGALFISVAGVMGAVLQSNFGYQGLFLAAVLLAIPGLATLLFLPLDEA